MIFLAASGSDELLDQFGNADRDDAQSFLQVLGVVLIVFCLLAFVFSIPAFTGRRWAAVALAVLGGLWIALSLYGLVSSGDPSGLIGVAYVIASTALVFLGSKDWFDHTSRKRVSS